MCALPSELHLLKSLGKLRLKHGQKPEIKAVASSLWPVLEAVDAFCFEGNEICAEGRGSRQLWSAHGTGPCSPDAG